MTRDAGVLADRQPETPAVDLEDRGFAAGREPLGLDSPEPDLAIGHPGADPVDREHRDMDLAQVSFDRRADERHGPGGVTGLDDGRQARVVGRDRWGVQLVAGQRHLGEDDDPCVRDPDRLGVRRRVRRHVMRHDTGLGDRDRQRLTHPIPFLLDRPR